MPRQFNGTSDHIQTTIGAFSANVAFGTMAMIWKSNAQARWHGLMGTHNSGGTVQWALEIDNSNTLSGGTSISFSSATGMTVTTADGWCILVYGKDTGSVAPRYHKCVLATDAWSHTNGSTPLANGTAPGAAGTWRFGRWSTTDYASGQFALAAAWTSRNLTDTEAETMSGGLHAWHALAPDAMWMFDQTATTQVVADITGKGANQNGVSGTTPILEGLPWWTYGMQPITTTRDTGTGTISAGFAGWGVPI